MWGQVAVERIGPNGMPQEIAITSLPLEEPLKVTVFSSNGDLLLEEGVAFNAARLEAFLEAGIETVCTPVEGESVDDCRYQLRYQKVG
ncbi:MAG: hypothetical protein L6Q71_08165, partial [Planctomycetes bacterium]|nr:hypothetical protein [Planctomycetota bacterium]